MLDIISCCFQLAFLQTTSTLGTGWHWRKDLVSCLPNNRSQSIEKVMEQFGIVNNHAKYNLTGLMEDSQLTLICFHWSSTAVFLLRCIKVTSAAICTICTYGFELTDFIWCEIKDTLQCIVAAYNCMGWPFQTVVYKSNTLVLESLQMLILVFPRGTSCLFCYYRIP